MKIPQRALSSISLLYKSNLTSKPFTKKIAFFSSRKYDEEFFTQSLNKLHLKDKFEFIHYEPNLKENTVKLAQDHDVVCAFVNDSLNEQVLTKLSEYNIKTIALRCSGFNNVNLEVAKSLGMTICRVPRYSPHSVAEHAMCLVLSMNRNIKKSMTRISEGNFELNGLLGFNMYKKTIGVVGTGKIGEAFVSIAKGFGCNVLCYDPFPNKSIECDQVRYTTIEDLFRSSDIISFHTGLSRETYHMVNDWSIGLMKSNVMLVNVSRGGIIDTKAVIRGLKSGKIGYVGMDVLENEEDLFFRDFSDSFIGNDDIARLLMFNNVIITGHQAFFTKEALTNIADVTLENIDKILSGVECENTI